MPMGQELENYSSIGDSKVRKQYSPIIRLFFSLSLYVADARKFLNDLSIDFVKQLATGKKFALVQFSLCYPVSNVISLSPNPVSQDYDS
jgi:hypothetical protein